MSNDDRDRLVRLLATPTPEGTDADYAACSRTTPADLIDRTWLDGTRTSRRRLTTMARPVFPLEGRDV